MGCDLIKRRVGMSDEIPIDLNGKQLELATGGPGVHDEDVALALFKHDVARHDCSFIAAGKIRRNGDSNDVFGLPEQIRPFTDAWARTRRSGLFG